MIIKYLLMSFLYLLIYPFICFSRQNVALLQIEIQVSQSVKHQENQTTFAKFSGKIFA